MQVLGHLCSKLVMRVFRFVSHGVVHADNGVNACDSHDVMSGGHCRVRAGLLIDGRGVSIPHNGFNGNCFCDQFPYRL